MHISKIAIDRIINIKQPTIYAMGFIHFAFAQKTPPMKVGT